jgi:hypothetical protein
MLPISVLRSSARPQADGELKKVLFLASYFLNWHLVFDFFLELKFSCFTQLAPTHVSHMWVKVCLCTHKPVFSPPKLMLSFLKIERVLSYLRYFRREIQNIKLSKLQFSHLQN